MTLASRLIISSIVFSVFIGIIILLQQLLAPPWALRLVVALVYIETLSD